MRKASSARKAPEPAESHAAIDDWIRRQMPGLQPILRRLDSQIRKAIPDLQYAVKWQKAYYGLPQLGWIIEVISYDVSVNVVFHGGADFDDPPSEGTGTSRYSKIRSLEEASEPTMLGWIEQAAHVHGWK